MSIVDYIKDRILLILLHLFCAVALIFYLKIMELPSSSIVIIILSWGFVLAGYLVSQYFQAKRKYKDILQTLEVLDQKYLICEMLKKPANHLYF